MEESFYPGMVNRAVVLIIPKKPFFEWEQAVFPELPSMEDTMDEYNSYLLPDSILPFDPKKALKEEWQWIFENELFGINTDENTWPKNRTWNLFSQWFDCKFSTVIYDLVERPLLKNE